MCSRHSKSLLASSKRGERKGSCLKDDANLEAFRNQLRRHNLKLRDIIGDGNCLFRSFADQMDNDQSLYAYYRERICDFIEKNRADFEPFITDRSFDDFLRILLRNGTSGGNECLTAFSRLYNANICIHQLNKPIWIVRFSDSPQHEIHISYHNFEHYSSVRKLADTTDNNNSIDLISEYDIDYIQSQVKNTPNRQLIRDILNENNGNIDEALAYFLSSDISIPLIEESNESIEKIMSITGIYDIDLVQQTYENNNLNIELTVEHLLTIRSENKEEILETQTKNEPESKRQSKTEKKKAKQERATERHRAQFVAENKITQQVDEQLVTNEQESAHPANMEFINI